MADRTDTQMSDREFAAEHFTIEEGDENTENLDPITANDMEYLADSTGPDTIDFMTETPEEETNPSEEVETPETPTGEPVTELKTDDSPYAGKTDAELRAMLEMEEKRRRDLQSWNDKRFKELQEQIQNQNRPVEQPQPVQQVTGEQIKQAVTDNPIAAFQWAVQHSPDKISSVISNIREVHGDAMADEAQVAYSQVALMYQQQHFQQQLEELRQEQMQERAPDLMRKGMDQIVEEFVEQDPEGFRRVAPRVMELVKAGWQEFNESVNGEVSPYTVRDYIQRNVLVAYREEAARARAGTGTPAPKEISPEEQVETGTPGSAPKTDERSEEDQIADEIVAAYAKGRYA